MCHLGCVDSGQGHGFHIKKKNLDKEEKQYTVIYQDDKIIFHFINIILPFLIEYI